MSVEQKLYPDGRIPIIRRVLAPRMGLSSFITQHPFAFSTSLVTLRPCVDNQRKAFPLQLLDRLRMDQNSSRCMVAPQTVSTLTLHGLADGSIPFYKSLDEILQQENTFTRDSRAMASNEINRTQGMGQALSPNH